MKTAKAAVVRADDPEYWEMKSQETLGNVVLLGERYTKDAVLEAAFLVEGRAPSYLENPDEEGDQYVVIGDEFYQLALRDYTNWQIKWWREAIQNSVDADATLITCSSKFNKEMNLWTVSCEDNGGGMDRETVIAKFLVLGASGKRGDPTKKGGFGKAKELLILPWVSWQLWTRDFVFNGSGGRYKVSPAPSHMNGVKITVTMPGDFGRFTTANEHARNFIKKCYIPGVEFRIIHENASGFAGVVNETLKADRAVGRLVKTFDKGLNVYFKPKEAETDAKSSYIEVRVDGLYMFGRHIGDVPGEIIAETTIPSTQILTANREGFSIERLGWDLDEFAGSIAKEQRTVLQDKSGMIRKKYKGSGKFTAAREQQFAAMFEEILAALKGGRPISGQKIILSDAQRSEYQKAAHDVLGDFQKERTVPEGSPKENIGVGAPSDYAVPPEAVQALMSIVFSGPAHLEAAIKQLAWEPDFFIANDIPGFRPPKEYFPEAVSAKVKKLIRFWAELCRFVLIQIGCPKSYGVGVHFSKDVAGSHIYEDGEDWLMLNPIKVTIRKGIVEIGDPLTSPIYDLANPEDIQTIYAIAVHECTHFADDLKYHDEVFASAMTYNVARTSGREKQIKEILKAIKSTSTGSDRPKRVASVQEKAGRYATRVAKDARDKGMDSETANRYAQQAYDRYLREHGAGEQVQ
jgi:hypothetical protein